MAKFRKKPVVIDAVQFNGAEWVDGTPAAMFDLSFDSPDWLDEATAKAEAEPGGAYLDSEGRFAIVTLEGTMTAVPGDWIIRGVHGELYPCKPEIFAATYNADTGATMDLACIEGDEIVVRVPISSLPHAASVAWDEEYGFEDHSLRIDDLDEFAKSFVQYLNDEAEDGTTVLHEAFDKAIVKATEQGAFGIASDDD